MCMFLQHQDNLNYKKKVKSDKISYTYMYLHVNNKYCNFPFTLTLKFPVSMSHSLPGLFFFPLHLLYIRIGQHKYS